MPRRLILSSALLYTVAFNLTFLIQELFLVLPKALVPGLHPILYHNNHTWQGSNPLASLLQGTGVLATLLSALLSLLLLRLRALGRGVRLFLVWMAFSGFFMALPQVVIGTLLPGSDVGMVMQYLRLDTATRAGAALAASLLMPLAGRAVAAGFLGCAPEGAQLPNTRARLRYLVQLAVLPALIAIPMIIAFRVPRELIEVVAVPAVVSSLGALSVLAFARQGRTVRSPAAWRAPIALPLAAAVTLLAVFQLFLRRGIPF
ncbi:MAG TPA: hypothetical protein VNX02_02775 [Steroidobacteraceae bacterium]|nr:hypothetical protein [Steroidobacteraceae bacterium]